MASPPLLPACWDGEVSGKERPSRELSSVPSVSAVTPGCGRVTVPSVPTQVPGCAGRAGARGPRSGSIPILAPSQLRLHPSSHFWVLAICTHPGAWLPTAKSLSGGPNCTHKLNSAQGQSWEGSSVCPIDHPDPRGQAKHWEHQTPITCILPVTGFVLG